MQARPDPLAYRAKVLSRRYEAVGLLRHLDPGADRVGAERRTNGALGYHDKGDSRNR